MRCNGSVQELFQKEKNQVPVIFFFSRCLVAGHLVLPYLNTIKQNYTHTHNVAAFRSSMRHLPAFQRRQPSVVHQAEGIYISFKSSRTYFSLSFAKLLTFSFHVQFYHCHLRLIQ